jgi:ABC-2 family transporter
LSPLDGLVVPTLGAYALVATFLLPFVAIRLVATERESGAGKLLSQTPSGLPARLAAKAGVLLVGWLAALLPGLLALLLWRLYGGHLDYGETANVLLGHLLHALLTVAVAVAAAAVCRSSASAAIVALGFTVGTWALAFLAEGREGFLARLAPFTPEAALRTFEHGELRLAVVAVVALASLTGFTFAGAWLDPFRSVPSRALRSAILILPKLRQERRQGRPHPLQGVALDQDRRPRHAARRLARRRAPPRLFPGRAGLRKSGRLVEDRQHQRVRGLRGDAGRAVGGMSRGCAGLRLVHPGNHLGTGGETLSGGGFPLDRQLFSVDRAIPEIQADQGLIGNPHLARQGVKILQGRFVESNRDLFLEPFRVRVLLRL